MNDSLKGKPVFSEVLQMERYKLFHFSFVIFSFPRQMVSTSGYMFFPLYFLINDAACEHFVVD